MKATEKRSATHPGGQLGLGRQFAWWATEGEVNMAMPAPAPVPVTIPCAPQNVTVDLLRTAFPRADLLVTVPRDATPTYIIDLYERGADLVVTDAGVRHAAAAVTSLLRRRSQFTGNVQEGGTA